METSQNFDWTVILPDFERLLTLTFYWLGLGEQAIPISGSNIVTDFFTILIFSFFIVFLSLYFIAFLRYVGRICSIYGTVKKLRKKSDNLIEAWDDVKYKSQLFKDFDDSLSELDGKLYANQDIEMYFSEKTLAPNLLLSKILPFISVLLTGLGVLGTFMGLQMGLSGLELDGNTSKLQGEIRLVAQGASIAFTTSVYGVSASLILNFFEKLFLAITGRRIIQIQLDFAKLFPLYPAMDVFFDIKKYEEESKNLLGGLAEQIGNNMQQSLDNFSQDLSSSFAKTASDAIDKIAKTVGESLTTSIMTTLVPAVEQMSSTAVTLGEKQTESSTDALQALVQQFVSSIGAEGDNQRQAMHKISDELSASFVTFSITMKDMIAQINDEQRKIFETQESHMGSLRDNMKAITNQQTVTLDALSGVISQHVEATEGVITQGKALHNETNKTNESLEMFATQISEASQSMSTASKNLNSFSNNIRNSIDRSATSVDNAMNVAKDVATIHKTATEQLSSLHQDFEELRIGLGAAADNIHKFVSNIGEEGNNQRQAIHKVSDKLANSLTLFETAMKDIIIQINNEQSKVSETQHEHMNNLRISMQAIMQQQETTLNALSSVVTEHMNSTKGVITQGQSLNDNVNKTGEILKGFANKIDEASQSISTASDNLREFSGDIRSSIERTAKSVDDAMETAQKVAHSHKSAIDKFDSTYHGFEQLRISLMTGAEQINQTITYTQQGFDTLVKQYSELQVNIRNHADSMGESTKQYMEDLDEHMAKLLQEYSSLVNAQVNERMTEWDKQTKDFCESIKNVVGTMAEFVDNLDQQPIK